MTGVRALTRTVVMDGEVFGPGDVPPPHIAERIRNPQCWAPVQAEAGPNWTPESGAGRVPEPDPAPGGLRNLDPQPADTDSSSVVVPAPGTVMGEPPAPDPVVAPDPEPGPELAMLPEPPRAGKGATTAAWRAYAEQFNVLVAPEAERGDIIALLKDDGYIK